MISVSNINIEFDGLTLNKMFNVISVDEPPAINPISYKFEMLPNGKVRQIATANADNEFKIVCAREGDEETMKDNLETLKDKLNNQDVGVLKISDNTTGEIYAQYNKAILVENKFMGAITDGQGVNFTLTWSVGNEL